MRFGSVWFLSDQMAVRECLEPGQGGLGGCGLKGVVFTLNFNLSAQTSSRNALSNELIRSYQHYYLYTKATVLLVCLPALIKIKMDMEPLTYNHAHP